MDCIQRQAATQYIVNNMPLIDIVRPHSCGEHVLNLCFELWFDQVISVFAAHRSNVEPVVDFPPVGALTSMKLKNETHPAPSGHAIYREALTSHRHSVTDLRGEHGQPQRWSAVR